MTPKQHRRDELRWKCLDISTKSGEYFNISFENRTKAIAFAEWLMATKAPVTKIDLGDEKGSEYFTGWQIEMPS